MDLVPISMVFVFGFKRLRQKVKNVTLELALRGAEWFVVGI